MADQPVPLTVSRQRGTKQYVVLALVVGFILTVAAGLSYYSEEIHLYLSLGGWNSGVAVRITNQFIRHLQAGQQQNALALVDPNSYKPYAHDGKVAGLEHQDVSGRGRYHIGFAELIPSGPVQVGSPSMTGVDGGGFIVPVQFADHTSGWFVVGRVGGRYRITSLPMVPGRFHY